LNLLFANKQSFKKLVFNISSPACDVNLAVFKVKNYKKKKINVGKFFELLKPYRKFDNQYYNLINFVFPDLFLEFDELLRFKFYYFFVLLLEKTTDTKKILYSHIFLHKLISLKQANIIKKYRPNILYAINKLKKSNAFIYIGLHDFDFSLLFYYKLSTLMTQKIFRKKNFFNRVSGAYGLRY
jgi:hypothetical protein